jgi:hypothetical protein
MGPSDYCDRSDQTSEDILPAVHAPVGIKKANLTTDEPPVFPGFAVFNKTPDRGKKMSFALYCVYLR